jgi:hypothetical protein
MNTRALDVDTDAEAEDLQWQTYCAVAKKLDIADLICTIAEEIAGDTDDHVLAHLIEAWLDDPEPDWSRPVFAPWQAEAVGKYVALIAAKAIDRALLRAMARHTDVAF